MCSRTKSLGLRRALERAEGEGLSHVILDGQIIRRDRCKRADRHTER
jgi:hypothetical protein